MNLDLSVDELVDQSHGRFNNTFLDRSEMGLEPLDDETARSLTELYQVDRGVYVPKRSQLIVDLPGRQIGVEDQAVDLPKPRMWRSNDSLVDGVLERYLSLLYLLRNVEPGTEIYLRDNDLAVLSESLEVELANIERRLAQLMLDERVDARTRSLIGRFLLPSAGLLVASTMVGSFVISSQNSPDVQPRISSESAPLPADLADASSVTGAVTGVELAHVETTIHAPPTITPTIAVSPQEILVEDEAVAPVTPAEIGQLAETLIPYDWQSKLSDWTIVYHGPRQGYSGMTNRPNQRIEIYIDNNDSAADVAAVLAHEIAHALDLTYLDDTDRMRWVEARGLPAVWWTGDGLADFNVGSGDFAEAVAQGWLGAQNHSGYGSATDAQLQLAQELLP